MGFVNINGNQIHTSGIDIGATGTIGTWSTGGLTITTGATGTGGLTTTTGATGTSTSLLYTIQPQTTTYHILGEDFEVEGWHNEWLSTQISHINTYAKIGLAKVYYEELKKNNIIFSDEIDEIIQKRLLIIERDRKINSIIDEK